MKRLGDKWFNNPEATHKHSHGTEHHEKELKALEETVSIISTQDADVLSVTAKHLKENCQCEFPNRRKQS